MVNPSLAPAIRPNMQPAALPRGLQWFVMIKNAFAITVPIFWRALRWVFFVALVLYVVFLVLVLAARYVLVPNIEQYRPWIEERASQALKLKVTVGTTTAAFRGIWPQLQLTDVRLTEPSGREALLLPKVEAALSWRTLVHGTPIFHSLSLDKPDLAIRRLPDGKFNVAGIVIDPNEKGEGGGLKWLLEQGEIAVKQGTLTWTDERRGEQPLAFSGVDFLYQNDGLAHRMSLQATPPTAFGAVVDARLNFRHTLFSRSHLPENWAGQFYGQLSRADLAQWSRYFDLPMDIRQGQGAVRFWVDFDDLTAQQVTTDVRMRDVNAKLAKDLPAMDLAVIDGRLQGRQLARDTAAHELQVQELLMVTRAGKQIGPLNLSESFRPATASAGASGKFSADALDLALLSELSQQLPLTPTVREALAAFNPTGQLRRLNMSWQAPAKANEATRFSAKGTFSNLSLAAQSDRALLTRVLAPDTPKPEAHPLGVIDRPRPGVPGFANLSGTFDVSDAGGVVNLDSKDAKLSFPGVFEQAMLPFEKLALNANWRTGASGIELKLSNVQFANADAQGTAQVSYKTGGKGPGIIELDGALARGSAAAVYKYLPVTVPQPTRDWLKNALKTGAVNSASFKVKGDLYDFPFHAPSGTKPTGEFLVTAKTSGVELDFAPFPLESGARWLPLQDVSGTFIIDRTRMAVKDAQGRMQSTRLSKLEMEIADTHVRSPMTITGVTDGPAQELVSYINTSPVHLWINNFTEATTISGNVRMKLDLALPLADMRASKVLGTVQFAGNDIALSRDLPPFNATAATLEFSEKGLQIPNARATIYGGPASFSGGTQPDGGLKFTGEGTAEIAQAKSIVSEPTLGSLIGIATGSARYSLNLAVRGGQTELKLNSDLAGVAFDYPGIATKTAAQTLPLAISISPKPRADANAPLSDELAVSLGSAVSAKFERVKGAAGMRVARGGVGINNEVVLPDSGSIALISLKTFDVDYWMRKLGRLQSQTPAGGGTAAGAADLPAVVAIRADELVIGGKKWDRVVAGASREGDIWQINVDATQLSGYATWRQAAPGAREAIGRLTARLAKLSIPQSQREEVAQLLDAPSTSELPGIDLVVEDFELGGKKLGRLEVLASNQRAWQLEKLVVENADAKLTGSGVWQRSAGTGARPMELTFSLDINNAGNLLTRLGFANTVRNGAGTLAGQINWRGIPLALDFPTLAGEVQLSLDKGGQFLKTDPGVGRLLGVLSLQSLPRRLSLDFRDVFSEGFVFDSINASATIKGGLLTTENFKMRGPQATVLLSGNADLVREQQNLRIVVLPDINLGAISFAYLFINPAVGLTSFLAQLLAREPLAKGLAQEFDIAGTWAEPKITKRERAPANNGNGVEPGE
jgi:uncharacterized protein (TIGR02099 family)